MQGRSAGFAVGIRMQIAGNEEREIGSELAPKLVL